MRKTNLLLLASLLLFAGIAHADHYADTYVIPAAGHIAGANGTTWMSDLAIRNFSSTPMTVQLIVIESGDDTTDNVFPVGDGSVTVNPSSTVLLRDILAEHRGRTNTLGALIVGADMPFAVTSRAYSNLRPLGQTVPATADFLDNSVGTADNTGYAYIPGVINNASTRTNVGFVAGSGGSSAQMVVEVSVRNGTGAVVGTKSYVIPAGRFAHKQVPLSSIASSSLDVGSVDFRVTEGEGVVVPYASVIDNTTGEAAYIMGTFPETGPPSLVWRPNLFRSLFRTSNR